MMNKQTILEIYNRIRDNNQNNKTDTIPTSDMIYRKMLADIIDNEQQLKLALKLLAEAHYIFIIRIVEPDENLDIQPLNGYVVAELVILRQVKQHAFDELEKAFSAQFYQRKNAGSIIRELVGEARTYNNTPLGNFLNMAMMLDQFEHYMEKSYHEFAEPYKRTRLAELLEHPDYMELGAGASRSRKGEGAVYVEGEEGFGIDEETGRSAKQMTDARRAIDAPTVIDLEAMDSSGQWGRAVARYGVQFLVRIHFRKYEFDKVKKLVRAKRIAREADLRYIRDTLRTIESRLEKDPELGNHLDQIGELRRMAQLKLNQIMMARKNKE